MDGHLDKGPKLRTPVENARDATLVLALLFSPAAHAQEQNPEESVVAFSGVDFSTSGRGFNMITPGPQFEVPPQPDPDVWVRTGNRFTRAPHLVMMDPPEGWGADIYRPRFPRHNAPIDLDSLQYERRDGFDFEDDRLVWTRNR